MPTDASSRTPSRTWLALAAAAVFLAALNLRPTVTSTGALLRDIQAATGMSNSLAAVLTTLPPICFGVFGLLAGRIGRRLGTENAVVVGMALVASALMARVATDWAWWLVLCTVPALAGMAVGNVLLPVAVKRWFPTRMGRVMGVYLSGLSLGTTLAAAATVPMAAALGSWRYGLAIWSVPATLAAVAWVGLSRSFPPSWPVVRGGTTHPRTEKSHRGRTRLPSYHAHVPRSRPVHRHSQAWALAGFLGLQGFGAYTVMGWLPTIFRDAGLSPTSAGLLLALTTGMSIPVSLVLPELAARTADQRIWVVGLAIASATGYVGLIVAPASAPVIWAVLVGTGLGAYQLGLVMVGLRARTEAATMTLSSLSQGTGYLIAATGPFFVGLIHDLTGGWTSPLLALLGLLIPKVALGLIAGRAGHVDVLDSPMS